MQIDSERRSRLTSAGLAGAWRATLPLPTLNKEQLSQISPFLLESGSAALVWRSIRGSRLSQSAAGEQLHQAYLWCTIHAGLHEHNLQRVYSIFRNAGLDPLLIKGWAIARLYPEEGLRPYGDLDLCVRPREFRLAEGLLRRSGSLQHEVDLHQGIRKLDKESFDALYARSQLVQLTDLSVRIPSLEDHLRILCVHLLAHGVWRPLWLCDIALLVENRPADFDWKLCLGREQRRADWVACAVGLAHQLLGAEIAGTPVEARARNLPPWLVKSVLKQWDSPPSNHVSHQNPLAITFRERAGILSALRYRWPNQIEATISVGGPFNDLPRLPFQLTSCLVRSAKFLAQLTKVET